MGAGQRCTMGNEGVCMVKAKFWSFLFTNNITKFGHESAVSRTTWNTRFFPAGV